MFYLGMRSPAPYLRRLAAVRNEAAPGDLISVAGGLAFLHAISAATTSLTLVDIDRDALTHWTLVRALIAEADSLVDFLGLLGQRTATGGMADNAIVFGARLDLTRRLASALPGEMRAVYERTYGALDVDARGVGRHGPVTVRFVGMSLEPHTFNWGFGEGNLADEAHFQALRARVAALPISLRQAPLQSLDFDAAYPQAAVRQRVCLASNCESPMFTPADAIFLRVLQTARHPVRYLSWHRDVVVAGGHVMAGAPATERPATIEPARTVVFPDGRDSVPLPDLPFRRTVHGLDELRDRPEYGRRLLLMLGHNAAEVATCLRAVAPAFRQVLWVPAGSAPGALDFALPNYRAEPAVGPGDRPAWRFLLAGCS